MQITRRYILIQNSELLGNNDSRAYLSQLRVYEDGQEIERNSI